MWGRPCRGCAAKDQEISHLIMLLEKQQQQLERAQARVSEIADPGITQRIEKKAPPPRPPKAQLVAGFPGYSPHVAPPRIVADEEPD